MKTKKRREGTNGGELQETARNNKKMLRIRKVKMQIDIGSSSKTKHLGILISLRRLTVGRE